MSDIQVQIQYTPEDLQQAYSAHGSLTNTIVKVVVFSIGVLSLAFGLFTLLVIKPDDKFGGTWLLLYGLISLPYFFWKSKSMGKRMFKKLQNLHTPVSYHISDREVQIIAQTSSSKIEWSGFLKALIRKDLILLYPSDAIFIFFPAKYFDPHDFQSMKDLVRRHVANVKEKE